MKRKLSKLHIFTIITVLTAAVSLTLLINRTNHANAGLLDNFKPGNIMSDYVMGNRTTMTEAEIQAFLKSKNHCNDTNITKAKQYPHLQYSIKDGHFVCMADEDFNGETAAHIIWQAAQDYKINPQVLIVLLQKEQGLVTDTWPNHIQYRSATGYGCPDTAPCDSQYYGLKNQIRMAARLFRTVLDGGWTNYPLGENYVLYNPNRTCGGSVINIENRATSALYRYTPYQPNAGALAAGYGTAPCGAYGNRNFYLYFSSWFGNPNTVSSISSYYKNLGGELSYLGNQTANEVCGLLKSGCYQSFQVGRIYWTRATGAWDVSGRIGDRWLAMNAEESYLGYPISTETKELAEGGAFQSFENGRIYWTRATGAWDVAYGPIYDKWFSRGTEWGDFGYPIGGPEKDSDKSGVRQRFENGVIYSDKDLNVYTVEGEIYNQWKKIGSEARTGWPTSNQLNSPAGLLYQDFENGRIYWDASNNSGWFVHEWAVERYTQANHLGKAVSEEVCGMKNEGCHQKFENGRIYWTRATGAWDVAYGPIYDKWFAQGTEWGRLGYPMSGEQRDSFNNSFQIFERGRIYTINDDIWEVSGGIGDRWLELGAEKSKLGYPINDENRQLTQSGSFQKFENGRIYWTRATGAWDVAYGPIYDKWFAQGTEWGRLGYPMSGEQRDSLDNLFQAFSQGRIYLVNGHAWEVSGRVGDRWLELGAEKSKIGYPIGDEDRRLIKSGSFQKFENGRIYWTRATGAWDVAYGPIYDKWFAQGTEWGRLGYPMSGEQRDGSESSQKFENGEIRQPVVIN